ESRKRQDVVAILSTRAVHENHRGMPCSGGWTRERPGQLNVAIRKADLFTLLDVDSTCGARSGALALPRQRRDLAGGIPLEVDSRLDRRGNRNSRTHEESVAVSRIQNSNLAGFIERNELGWIVESAELIPQL